jgi:putative acetyltransferase
MLSRVLIRREVPSDGPAVHQVHAAAFSKRDRPGKGEAELADELRAAGDAIPALSLVAEFEGAVVGHVVGSRALIGAYASVGIGPVGVLPGHQGKGVGTALMHAVVAAADALDLPEVVLLGNPAYYGRFGFRLAQPLGVLPPDPMFSKDFQIRTLTTWTDERKGAFRFAPAFDDM